MGWSKCPQCRHSASGKLLGERGVPGIPAGEQAYTWRLSKSTFDIASFHWIRNIPYSTIWAWKFSRENTIIDVWCQQTAWSEFGLDCINIAEVSALGGVHTLDLSECSGITDVSALGRMYNLILSGCFSIMDASTLGGVHTSNLKRCGISDECSGWSAYFGFIWLLEHHRRECFGWSAHFKLAYLAVPVSSRVLFECWVGIWLIIVRRVQLFFLILKTTTVRAWRSQFAHKCAWSLKKYCWPPSNFYVVVIITRHAIWIICCLYL